LEVGKRGKKEEEGGVSVRDITVTGKKLKVKILSSTPNLIKGNPKTIMSQRK